MAVAELELRNELLAGTTHFLGEIGARRHEAGQDEGDVDDANGCQKDTGDREIEETDPVETCA